MGAGPAAAVGTLGPVLTVLAAWLLLDEPLSALQLAGLALVLFGVTRLKPANKPKPMAIPGNPKAVNE
jgi:multidrug transporter EmrE-like cation transporter